LTVGRPRAKSASRQPKPARDQGSGALHTIAQIKDDLSLLDDWEDRYRYIIEIGRELPDLPESERTEANKVRGCASQVWLSTSIERSGGDPIMHFAGDSDAHIVRGLVALALALYSGRPASQVAASDAVGLFTELGLKEHLSAQRSNGFRSLVDRIRNEAARALAEAPAA